jgi:glutaredoxin 3
MVEVNIYTRQLCGYCAAAINLLKQKGVPFTEFDATFDPDLRKQMLSRSQGASTFPQIFVGDIHVGGCDDLMAMAHSGNLEDLLES